MRHSDKRLELHDCKEFEMTEVEKRFRERFGEDGMDSGMIRTDVAFGMYD